MEPSSAAFMRRFLSLTTARHAEILKFGLAGCGRQKNLDDGMPRRLS